MKILGIDPGIILTGYGIINSEKNTFTKICSGVIKLPSSASIPKKLSLIYNEINSLIETYSPDEFAIETAFYGKNVQSAMKIGYARGVSLLAAVHNNLITAEYSPREVKKSIVGSGAASKEQVFFMVCTLLNMKKEKMKYDESDALAVALCHSFKAAVPMSKKKSWKSFIEAYPERVVG
jgi:crossover junction endodeoxyribonuclease RuvC